jgi:hypothetical protein
LKDPGPPPGNYVLVSQPDCAECDFGWEGAGGGQE